MEDHGQRLMFLCRDDSLSFAGLTLEDFDVVVVPEGDDLH